ncbi:MAG: hypothetical protein ACI8W8_001400 [Rhodothermales bacterium]|jgi:hypothetical protein
MKNTQTSGGLGIAIGAALILAIAILALFTVSRPTTAPNSAPSTTGAAKAGVIDYTVTPLRVNRNSEGQLHVEAEVLRKDSSDWTEVSVHNISVTGQTKATATLISPLPTDPIPERFVLEFLCDASEGDGKGSHLRFDLNIKAEKHLGLSSGGSQRSNRISLEPMESVSE